MNGRICVTYFLKNIKIVGDHMFLKRIKLLHKQIPSYNRFPFSIPSIKSFHQLDLNNNNVTFFVGENGSGKSTLLEAIADKCDFNTAGGGKNNYYELHNTASSLGENELRLASSKYLFSDNISLSINRLFGYLF